MSQPISEVAIIILRDIDKHLDKIAKLNTITEIRQELSDLRTLLDRSIGVIQLITKVNQNNAGD